MRLLAVLMLGLCVPLGCFAADASTSKPTAFQEAWAEYSAPKNEMALRLKLSNVHDAGAALAELDYRGLGLYFGPLNGHAPNHDKVKTISGNDAEVVVIDSTSPFDFGNECSMAFLLVNDRLVDWASCWDSTRNGSAKVVLQDVDGDGVKDVAFRSTSGMTFGAGGAPHDASGRWVYTYAITDNGFRCIYSRSECELPFSVKLDPRGNNIALEAYGQPSTVRDQHTVRFTVTATNVTAEPLRLPPDWLDVQSSHLGWERAERGEHAMLLQPGSTVSKHVDVHINGCAAWHGIEAALHGDPNKPEPVEVTLTFVSGTDVGYSSDHALK
jgi:hypothetical protein